MACLAWLAHGTWGARDARNALLAHRSCGTHLAISWRSLRTWGDKRHKRKIRGVQSSEEMAMWETEVAE